MAGQFDDLLKVYNPDSKPVTGPWKEGQKLVKNLGVGAKPDTVEGTWTGENEQGGPKGAKAKQTVYPAVADTNETDIGGKDTNITQAAVNVAQGRRTDIASRDLELQRGELRGNARKRQIKGLGTTTMRLDEKTGEAYDTEDVKSFTSGRVMPTRQANPKYLAADAQRQNEDLAAATEADRRKSGVIRSEEELGEYAFNASEKASGSNLRSINGITYNMSDYRADGPEGLTDTRPERPSASEIRGATWAGSQAEAQAKATGKPIVESTGISNYKAKKTAGELTAERFTTTPTPGVTEGPNKSDSSLDYDQNPTFEQVDKIKARKGGKIYGEMVLDNIERESEGPTTVKYGDTLSKANTEGTNPYNKDGSVKPEYNDPNNIHSTTMHEHNGEIVEGGVQKAPYQKPPVAKRGNVIPQNLIDTATGSDRDVDTTQAELENKNLRENRTNPTRTSPYDPNTTPNTATFGRTPERDMTQAAMRASRAADLASQGKEMTTVRPEIMSSAKALAATSRFGLKKDDPYFDTTDFLNHPAIQEATIAHAFGVHHDVSILHRALGGRAPEVARRRNAWFKVADRKLRGNPEKVPGEFEVLGAAIRKGTPPGTVTRKLERGQKPGITLNGQAPTLAPAAPVADVKSPTRAGTRAMHANTTANMMYQQQQSEREARNIMTFTPLKTTTMRLNEATGEAYDMDDKDEALKNAVQSSSETTAGIAPAGSDTVTVSNPKKGIPPTTRRFTAAERLNKGNVPNADDSKRRL
jgi:hypothetical protein